MMEPFGIHVGATTTSIAIRLQDGKVEIIANDAGDRITPAIVAFNGAEKTVGISARQGLIRNSGNTVCHVKSLIGSKPQDEIIEKYNKTHACKLISKNEKLCFGIEYSKDVTIQTVMEAVISNIIGSAKSRCGQLPTYSTVIAVPYHYTEEQKDLIKQCTTNCGFSVMQVISEPSACLLAYNIGQANPKQDGYCLVYRVGGQTLDVTIAYVSSGIYSVISSVIKSGIAGDAMTDLLVSYFAGEFKKKTYCDLYESRRSVAKLVVAAENCKRILSTISTAQCSVESLHEGVDFNSNITRARYESLLSSLIPQLISPIDEALQKAKIFRQDINQVILAGGAMKTPKLQQNLNEIFPKAELFSSIPPDEVIAIGCARQAGIQKKLSDLALEIPCLSRGIYINVTENGSKKLHCIFSRLTLVPAHAQKILHLPEGQNSLCMELWENDKESTSVLLGKVVLKDLPNDPEIGASFHIRRDGSLHVTCTEKRTEINSGITVEASISS